MRISGNNIICSDKPEDNILVNGENFYEIKKLPNSEGNQGGKGGNSNVFILNDSNEDKDYIIKFCQYKLGSNNENTKKRIYRFENEIRALEKAGKLESTSIIHMFFSGQTKIKRGQYRYYVMEKGDGDLTDFLKENDIPIEQKVLLCTEIIKGIKELHDMEIYHRDIKPDNIFFVNSKWKIGDLGLIAHRDEDQNLDSIQEKIGPYGWLSPEAINKALCEGTPLEEIHSCKIDKLSDVFQLGKLFWYIFHGNIPIGQISETDFLLEDSILFEIIHLMLNYSKTKRPELDEIKAEFEKTYAKYAI